MRTGKEYRDSLRDGRRVWIVGEGAVDDVTVHPATRAMVDEYVEWYDRHFEPAWQDVVLTPPDAEGRRSPWAFVAPTRSDDLRGMGRCYAATSFLSAGNITHTPAYGNLIALGVRDAVRQRDVAPEQLRHATGYREHLVASGRFLTFSAGAATIGARLRENPAERIHDVECDLTVANQVADVDLGLTERSFGGHAIAPHLHGGPPHRLLVARQAIPSRLPTPWQV